MQNNTKTIFHTIFSSSEVDLINIPAIILLFVRFNSPNDMH